MKDPIRKFVYAALCTSLCIVLPFLTFGVQSAGQVLCLMHLPVFLCGLICGWQWGGAVGTAVPLLRFLLFGQPPLPSAGFMAAELAVYGVVTALLYRLLPKRPWAVYPTLVGAMLAGRCVNGVVKTLYYLGTPGAYGWTAFLTQSFVTSLPGIVIALVLVPAVTAALARGGLLPTDCEFFVNRQKTPQKGN